MSQRIDPPDAQELARIEAQRSNWIERSDTVKLQCLGVALGDALVQELSMLWVTVEDEYGRDLAIELPGTSVLVRSALSTEKKSMSTRSSVAYAARCVRWRRKGTDVCVSNKAVAVDAIGCHQICLRKFAAISSRN